MDVEKELDRLYQLPARDFVSERNALARALRTEGRREDAAHIARRERPTPVAWLMNQLHFHDRALLDALLEAGEALRQAQESVGAHAEIAEAKRAHQQALAAATRRALEVAEGQGIAANATLKRRVELTLTLISASKEPVDPAPGRMSAELEPTGFDALTEAAAAPPPRRAKREAPKTEDAERQKSLAESRTLIETLDKAVRKLEREAEVVAMRAERAERDADEAARHAEQLRAVAVAARDKATEARRRVDEARGELEEARRAVETIV